MKGDRAGDTSSLGNALTRRRTLLVSGGPEAAEAGELCVWLLARAGFEPGWFIPGASRGAQASIGPGRVRPHLASVRAPFVVQCDRRGTPAAGGVDATRGVDVTGVLDVGGVLAGGGDPVALVTDGEGGADAMARAIPTGGLIVAPAPPPSGGATTLSEASARVVYYGLERDAAGEITPTWLGALAQSSQDGFQWFDVYVGGVFCGRFARRGGGADGVRRALGALAACTEGFGLRLTDARPHLAAWPG
jgi:hypothetical protein